MTTLAIPDAETGEVVPVEKAVMQARYSLDELVVLADRINGTGMVPRVLRNKPDEVLAVFIAGSEIGLPIMQSLQLIDMIDGRPALNAQGQRAVILGHGHRFWIEATTATEAVACGQRSGEEHVHRCSFTIEEARQMGLLGKSNWKNSPADMLVARATTRLARRAFADCLLGIAYDPEELEPVKPFTMDSDPRAAIEAGAAFLDEKACRVLETSCAKRGMSEVDIERLVEEVTGDRCCTFAECLATEYPALKRAIVAVPSITDLEERLESAAAELVTDEPEGADELKSRIDAIRGAHKPPQPASRRDLE